LITVYGALLREQISPLIQVPWLFRMAGTRSNCLEVLQLTN
jgi:hypothetical protein